MDKHLPLFFKLLFSGFLAILIPVYWICHGPANFLWFSDISLLLAYIAVIFERRLPASMAIVGGLVLESIWVADFLLILFFDIHLTTLTDYMFSAKYPIWLRGLSLFHMGLLPLYFFLLSRLGYDRRAWLFQTGLAWIALLMSYWLSTPQKNINWVFIYKKISWLQHHPMIYLSLEAIGLCIIYLTTHYLILFLCRLRSYATSERRT